MARKAEVNQMLNVDLVNPYLQLVSSPIFKVANSIYYQMVPIFFPEYSFSNLLILARSYYLHLGESSGDQGTHHPCACSNSYHNRNSWRDQLACLVLSRSWWHPCPWQSHCPSSNWKWSCCQACFDCLDPATAFLLLIRLVDGATEFTGWMAISVQLSTAFIAPNNQIQY